MIHILSHRTSRTIVTVCVPFKLSDLTVYRTGNDKLQILSVDLPVLSSISSPIARIDPAMFHQPLRKHTYGIN